MTYIVPPRKIVVVGGRTYGAGQRVPGYTAPDEPSVAGPEPKVEAAKKAVETTDPVSVPEVSAYPFDVKRKRKKKTIRRHYNA